MNKEILYVVKSLSNEKGVSEDAIFEAIELALAAVTARRYTEDTLIRVVIDRETAESSAFRCWAVVADDAEIELPGQQMTLAQAREDFEDDNLNAGDMIEEPVESAEFGRIAAQQAKQVIVQKVREAEREKIEKLYQKRIGEMMMGVVKRVARDFLVVDFGANAEALLPRDQMIPREAFRMNDRIRVLLLGVRDEKRGPQLLVSRTSSEFITELFKVEVPEIGEEIIEIMGAARDAGSRAKIAVKTNDGRIDPIGACVGMRGARVQAVSGELNGERVDIVLWDDNPAQLVINAMAPAEVVSIVVDEDNHSMDIAVAEEQLSQAIGRSGQNVRLAAELTGWALNVMSETEAAQKHESEAVRLKELFAERLDIEPDVAMAIVSQGFSSIESLAYASDEDLRRIGSFNDVIATELRDRANDLLLMAELEVVDAQQPAEDLANLEGVSEYMLASLSAAGIRTRDDLAEQSIDELQEVLDIDDEAAGKIIMKAREHWFSE